MGGIVGYVVHELTEPVLVVDLESVDPDATNNDHQKINLADAGTASTHPGLSGCVQVQMICTSHIENAEDLRIDLARDGCKFDSGSDSEIIMHLIDRFVHYGLTQAVLLAVHDLKGSFAFVATSTAEPGILVGANYDAPLFVGTDKEQCYISCDHKGLLNHTSRIISMTEGGIVTVRSDGVEVIDFSGRRSD